MVQPEDPRLDEPEPELAEHLFGHVEPTGKRPIKKMRVARDRREIRLGPDIRRIVDECIEALSADPRTFSRANELVTIIGAPPDMPRDSIAAGTPIIRSLTSATIVERLTDFARVVKYIAKNDTWAEVPTPSSVTNALMARGDWNAIRPLVGVVEHPLFRPDGTVRQERGYDAATGYVYLPSADYPEVPEHPTQEDARRALRDLEHIFVDFPYVSDAHRMVPIAAILTMFARSAIAGSVPAFLFDASTRGSGKTLQAEVVHEVVFGRSAARKTYPAEDEELDKLLAGYALFGARCILLDNVTRAVGGGPLDAYLTAREAVEFRVLGQTRVMRLPWHAVIMLSGNNLVLSDDTIRRVLMARLEPPFENPEDRTEFEHVDLPAWVRANRPRLVVAALTILRAYAVVGRPDAGLPRWGSFEAWSRLVPHAIVFAGGVDPMQARPRGERATTDDLTALATVLRELPRMCTERDARGLTAKDIIRFLWPRDRHPDDGPDGWEDMRDAIEQWAAQRSGTPTAKGLGRKLGMYEGRVLSGRRLRGHGSGDRPLIWSVEAIK